MNRVPAVSVLLVEPSDDDRDMYSEYLRLRGFTVDTCANADDSFTRAAAADVIVTAIRLHGEYDGIEFVRRLRQKPSTSRKPIVVLTASTFTDDRQRALDAGCDAFLIKPCLPDVLAAEIRRVTAGQRRANRRSDRGPTPGELLNDRRDAQRRDRRRNK